MSDARCTQAFAALAVTLLTSGVSAQTTGSEITINVTGMEGRTSVDLADLSSQTARPVSQAECDSSAQIDFQFNNVDSTRANLEFFYGSSCNDSAVRNSTDDTSCTALEYTIAIENRQVVEESIAVDALIDCAGETSGTRNLWVLALSNPTEDVLGVGQSGAFDLAFDFSAPEAPQNLTARDGESGFIVSWDASSDQISQYEVFVVDGCGTTIDPDSLSPTSTIDGPAGSTEVSFDASTPFGAEFTVAVRAIDSAGNASALSDSACVTRIEVDSWWDVYCNGPDRSADACSGGGGCAVGPGTPSPAVGGIWLATAMLLALIRRRR